MIKLVQFGISKVASTPNYSPFCVKLEAILRAMDIEFEIEPFNGNPAKFSKGKLPVIRDGDKIIEDSELIYQYLVNKGYKDLDEHLTDLQKAQTVAFKALIEDNLTWFMMRERWQSDNNWNLYTKNALFGHMPAFAKLFIPNIIRKSVVKTIYGQGTGRYNQQEISNTISKKLKALSLFLDDQDYFFGNQLSSLDCTVFGLLVNFMAEEINPSLTELITPHSNLVAFVARMRKRLFDK